MSYKIEKILRRQQHWCIDIGLHTPIESRVSTCSTKKPIDRETMSFFREKETDKYVYIYIHDYVNLAPAHVTFSFCLMDFATGSSTHRSLVCMQTPEMHRDKKKMDPLDYVKKKSLPWNKIIFRIYTHAYKKYVLALHCVSTCKWFYHQSHTKNFSYTVGK